MFLGKGSGTDEMDGVILLIVLTSRASPTFSFTFEEDPAPTLSPIESASCSASSQELPSNHESQSLDRLA